MELEPTQGDKNTDQNDEQHKISKATKSFLLFINCLLVTVGSIAGPLLMRLYYLHGGKKRWLSSWLLTAGFPLLIFPISLSFFRNRKKYSRTTTIFVTPWLVMASAFLGFILGFSVYLYSIGISYLPVSIYSLLCTSQLAFTAIFASFVVKHKFTHYSINAIVLMILGSAILGIHMNGNRPSGVSDDKYMFGFFMTIVGSAIHGFMLPAVEYTHLKAGVPVTTNIVMQIQFLIMMFATSFCTVPMIINKDFQGIAQESKEFELGARNYFMIIVFAGLSLQMNVMGSLGVIFCSSSLFGGILTASLVPIQQICAVIFIGENFKAENGIALAMCLWAFVSYFYGQYKINQKRKNASINQEEEEQVAV